MSAPALRRASSPSGPLPAAGCTESRLSSQDAASAHEPRWQQQRPPKQRAGGPRQQEADDVDDVLRLLRLSGDCAAEPLMGSAPADGAGSGGGASSCLHELDGDNDDFLIRREAHQPAATTCAIAAAAAAVHMKSAPGRDESRPRISFANALPPRLPPGDPVRWSTAQLGRLIGHFAGGASCSCILSRTCAPMPQHTQSIAIECDIPTC